MALFMNCYNLISHSIGIFPRLQYSTPKLDSKTLPKNPIQGVAEKITLILNSENIPGKLPCNFRMCSDPWLHKTTIQPSREGLDKLNASGSGQFSVEGLKEIQKRLNTLKAATIVDLRQESHGFANGIALSWYARRDTINVGKTLDEIEADEDIRLKALLKNEIKIDQNKPLPESKSITIKVQEVFTERVLTQNSKIGYFRIPATDHLPPTNENVERFLTFIKNLPPDVWLHFHCEAGDGRTTTFLSMYDMYFNAGKVSFEDIIERQYLIGGMDLFEMPKKKSWKYPYAVERIQFLQEFYNKIKGCS